MEIKREASAPTSLAMEVDVEANAATLPVQLNNPFPTVSISNEFDLKTNHGPKAWVYLQYALIGFDSNGKWKGYRALSAHLNKVKTISRGRAVEALSAIRKGKCAGLRVNVKDDAQLIGTQGFEHFYHRCKTSARAFHTKESPSHFHGLNGLASGSVSTQPFTNFSHTNPVHIPQATAQIMQSMLLTSHDETPKDDLLARKLNQLQNNFGKVHGSSNAAAPAFNEADAIAGFGSSSINSKSMDSLLSEDSDYMDEDPDNQIVKAENVEVQQAPLLIASIVEEYHGASLPQYGLLGSYEKEKVFLNTNTPFSAFICGVQGSGKSHTTSCILENALIPSPQLGILQKPLSALIFTYGPFSGEGSGYSISEAAFLAAPHVHFPDHPRVQKLRVLVPPSNHVKLARLYLRIPNITVTQFKLKPANLDIDIMLTLMNVSENADTPLYMAAVTQLLRQMATEGIHFDYFNFKTRLETFKFNPAQVNMLQMRLGLLESFLDLENSCSELQFAEGEATIIDLSCPFVDANTACVLFRICLQRYLQSHVAGKMIVLDEAHKYMLPNPGARALNKSLRTTIRMQRHYGARVVISTQEPTLFTDLIALCSITVIHRFSSPEWFASIKRHIPMQANELNIVMKETESLKTGTALVYSPNAALGRDEAGRLVKGTGKLLQMKVRKRVTDDGGQSVLAV